MGKRWMSAAERAREAMMAAYREHDRLGLDVSERVDVFGIIERQNIWLIFTHLEDLYGTYERQGDTPGIFISDRHPLNLQRYTAAHEYGHHILGHLFSVDDAETIDSSSLPSPQEGRTFAARSGPVRTLELTPEQLADEHAAQVFAAHFLMPPQLVNTVLRRLGLPRKPEDLTPAEAYRLSLELGTSYAATVNHLADLRSISRQRAAALRQHPKEIKAIVGRGSRPADPWADTWSLDERDAGSLLHPRVRDEVHIALPEMPSTGYVWMVDEPDIVGLPLEVPADDFAPDGTVALIRDDFERDPARGGDMRFGGEGIRRLVFRVGRVGRQALRLAKRRPWQRNSAPVDTFTVELDILPQREIGSGESGGVRERVRLLLTV